MNSASKNGPALLGARSENFHRWRSRKDFLARRIIGLGGLVVIAAVLLILFYLLVRCNTFIYAGNNDAEPVSAAIPTGVKATLSFLSLEEQQQVALRVSREGTAEFFSLDGMSVLTSRQIAEDGQKVVAVAEAQGNSGLVAVAFDDGRVKLLQHHYTTDFSAGVEMRTHRPTLEFPVRQRQHGFDARWWYHRLWQCRTVNQNSYWPQQQLVGGCGSSGTQNRKIFSAVKSASKASVKYPGC